jgi:multidrug efflux pump subunit AcrB
MNGTPANPAGSQDDDLSLNWMTRVVGFLLRGDVSLMLIAISLLVGLAALAVTPREEEPQIVVPMADVMIEASGLSASQVEGQVTERLEKLLFQIDGVEYVYSHRDRGKASSRSVSVLAKIVKTR